MKRFLSFLLAWVLTLGLCPVHAHAQEAVAEETAPLETIVTIETGSVEEAATQCIETEIPSLLYNVPSGWFDYDNNIKETEPNGSTNGSTAKAEEIPVGAAVSARLESMDAEDYFKFEITEKSTITVTYGYNHDVYVVLYDSTEKALTSDKYAESFKWPGSIHPGYSIFRKISICLDIGTYYLKFYAYNRTVNYKFCVEAEAHTHSYGDWVVTKQPTETTEGLKVKTCSACGDTLEEVLPKQEHVHNYTAVVTNPTCVDQGYTTYTCTCGDSYKEDYVPATGVHTYTDDMDATCNVCGYVRESESGSSIEKPVEIVFNTDYRKEWTKDGEIHYVRFTTSERGIVTVSMTNPVISAHYFEEYVFTILDSSENTVYTNNCSKTVTGDTTRYSFHCGLDAGTYYLKIEPRFYSFKLPIISDYRITFTPDPYCEAEPNDAQANATTLTLGKQYTGHYGGNQHDVNQMDYYVFPVTEGHVYTISFENFEEILETTTIIELSGGKKEVSLDYEIENSDNSSYTFRAESTGNCYIRFWNHCGTQYTYQFMVEDLGPDAPVFTPVEAVFGEDYRKEWDRNDEYHYVKFTLPERGIATFHVTKPVMDNKVQKYNFIICDAFENTILGNYCYYSVDDARDYFEFHCGLAAGTYYLKMDPRFYVSSGTVVSDYRITFTPDPYCEVESNEEKESATALTLGKLYTGYYGSDGKSSNDYYKFDVVAGHTYKIAMDGYDKLFTTIIQLIGGTNTNLKYSMSNQDEDSGLYYYTFEAPATETCYIRFYNYSRAQFAYKIIVTDLAADVHTHSHTAAVTAPTCTEEGYTTHTCSCGDSYVDTKVPALGHDYVNGICTRCGEADPDYSEVAALTRIAGDGRCQTAMKAADELKTVLGVAKFQTIVVADGNNYPDALSGSYLAAVSNAPILLVQANQKKVTQTVIDYIINNLNSDGTVYILGGPNSIPADFENSIRSSGFTVKRLAGNDRYATSLMIVEEANAVGNGPADTLLVCAGGGYADSLSASATGKPVLLVNGTKTSLTTSQKTYLSQAGKPSIYVIGGPNSVSDAILNELKQYGSSVKRIAGNGREETSAAVAYEFFPDATFAVLADGNNYPDGLSGGPVAYAKKAPLLLIRSGKESHAKDYVGDRIKKGFIMGGVNSVSDKCVKNIFGAECLIK